MRPWRSYIRDNIGVDDTLVASVGGNDIAMMPSCCTVCSMLGLVYCSTEPQIRHGDACCLPHFTDMFKTDVQRYIELLVSKTKPKAVVVSMIYFPDEAPTGSWADCALGCMGYGTCPSKLQAAITRMFVSATSQIAIPGTEIIPLALYDVLDGKTSADYEQRVEPSVEGSAKIAGHVLAALAGVAG